MIFLMFCDAQMQCVQYEVAAQYSSQCLPLEAAMQLQRILKLFILMDSAVEHARTIRMLPLQLVTLCVAHEQYKK
jgi:hypothetical protein